MKVKQIVGEAADQMQVYKADQELREKNPQYAAEVAKLPGLIRGMGPEAQKHNQMVWGEIAKILQKYKALPVQEEVPGSEVGTTTSPVKPDGTVDVKKSDGTTVAVSQSDLKPGTAPNTLTMPTPKVAPGEKVIAAPATMESADNELLEKMRMIAGLR
jgi:hypothetical protein